MYGPRPQPPSLQQQVDKALEFAQSTKDKFTVGEPNPKPPDVQSAWLARMLIHDADDWSLEEQQADQETEPYE